MYDPMAVMAELLSTVDAVFEEKQEIKATATELDLSELKVKKLLITSGKLHYPQTGEIQELQRAGKKPEEIQNLCGVSYIYPIFYRFGLIEVPEKVKEILNGKKKYKNLQG